MSLASGGLRCRSGVSCSLYSTPDYGCRQIGKAVRGAMATHRGTDSTPQKCAVTQAACFQRSEPGVGCACCSTKLPIEADRKGHSAQGTRVERKCQTNRASRRPRYDG